MTTFLLILAGLNASVGCINMIGYARTAEAVYAVVGTCNFVVAALLILAV